MSMKFNETIIFNMILFSAALYGSLKMQVCIQSVLFFPKFGRSFKSLADTSSGIQVTNVFMLIDVHCFPAIWTSLVNRICLYFLGKWMSYVLLKYEIIKLVHNQFYLKTKWNARPVLLPFPNVLCCSIPLSPQAPSSVTVLWRKHFSWSNQFLEASGFSYSINCSAAPNSSPPLLGHG